MSTDDQAAAYLEEAELTLSSATAIFETAQTSGDELWAQVVKNGYDAIEQAVSAAIAAEGQTIPRRHPAKINAFIDLYEPDFEELLLEWLRRRSEAQYVDIRGAAVTVPHRRFTRQDAESILEDAETVLDYVRERI